MVIPRQVRSDGRCICRLTRRLQPVIFSWIIGRSQALLLAVLVLRRSL